MTAKRKHLIRNRTTTIVVGLALTVAGSLLLYDGFEGRGHQRPWITRLIPGA